MTTALALWNDQVIPSKSRMLMIVLSHLGRSWSYLDKMYGGEMGKADEYDIAFHLIAVGYWSGCITWAECQAAWGALDNTYYPLKGDNNADIGQETCF